MRLITFFFSILLIILGVAFALLNAQSVEVNYLIGTKTLSLVILLFIAFTLGVLVSFTLIGLRILKLKMHNKLLEHKLKKTQDELKLLQP